MKKALPLLRAVFFSFIRWAVGSAMRGVSARRARDRERKESRVALKDDMRRRLVRVLAAVVKTDGPVTAPGDPLERARAMLLVLVSRADAVPAPGDGEAVLRHSPGGRRILG